MLMILKGVEKQESFYLKDNQKYLSIGSSKEKKECMFCKLYEQYTGNKFPVYSNVPNLYRAFITEKPIEELKEDIIDSLTQLKMYKKDKRISTVLFIIDEIINNLNEDKMVLNRVEFSEIDKSFMGGDMTLKNPFSSYKHLQAFSDVSSLYRETLNIEDFEIVFDILRSFDENE